MLVLFCPPLNTDDFPKSFPCMVGRPLQDGGSGGGGAPLSSEPLKVRGGAG